MDNKKQIGWPQEYVEYRFLASFDTNLGNVPDEIIGKWTQSLDAISLEIMLKGASEYTRNHVLDNLQHDRVTMITEDVNFMGPISGTEIDRATIECYRNLMTILLKRDKEFLEERCEDASRDKISSCEDEPDPKAVDELLDQNPIYYENPERARYMSIFSDFIDKLDDRTLQAIGRRLDKEDLAVALWGLSREARVAIFNNLSKRQSVRLANTILKVGPAEPDIIYDKVGKILSDGIRIIKQENLECNGFDFKIG